MTNLLCICSSHRSNSNIVIKLHGFSLLGEKRKAQIEMPKAELSPNKLVVQYFRSFDVTDFFLSFFKNQRQAREIQQRIHYNHFVTSRGASQI